ncbi:MAG TPA: hypothetical protein VFP68_21595 [Burkholderiaceae bacterium]|nr:hypothetical protein [Burkholderiaceae bacterium]
MTLCAVPFEALSPRMQRLVAQTIDPAVATELMSTKDAGENIIFDGFGRIQGFTTPLVPDDVLARLESSITKPLTKTNSAARREAPRTDREILVRAMHILGMSNSLAHQMLKDDAKELFLSGSLNRQSVGALMEKCARLNEAEPLFHDQFNKLAAEAAKPLAPTQLVDNIYGRTFESLLVARLVEDPPPGVLKAARQLASEVLGELANHPKEIQDRILGDLASAIAKEPRPWWDRSPSIQPFLQQPTLENLQACFAANSGIEAIQSVFIAKHFALTLDRTGLNPDWMHSANRFYWSSLVSQKPQNASILTNFSQTSGNLLHYHPTTDQTPGINAYSWTHSKVVSVDNLTPWQAKALSKGQTIINGLSGTTNILAHLGKHIAQKNPEFREPEHHLNILMFVVFDGGHSTEEVLCTLDAIEQSRQGKDVSGKTLGDFGDGYQAIEKLGATEADRQALQNRVDEALNQTVEHFATHVA